MLFVSLMPYHILLHTTVEISQTISAFFQVLFIAFAFTRLIVGMDCCRQIYAFDSKKRILAKNPSAHLSSMTLLLSCDPSDESCRCTGSNEAGAPTPVGFFT